MNIAIVGTGYVGLVSGVCFAEMGADVTCVDIDKDKIAALRRGEVPIYEPGLEEMLRRNVEAGRLHFATSLAECIDSQQVVFSAVGTPPAEDGGADLGQVWAVARDFGRAVSRYTLLVTKSTVPVGTAEKIEAIVREELALRGEQVEFDVASNPEFLKEGAAIKDFMTPDRVVVGTTSQRARRLMSRLYKPFMLMGERIIFTDVRSAEMIKYAANSMLATRISFMNEIANLCERVGADVNMVRKGIGSDSRIGKKFLYPGCGFGGSCFPKDLRALIRTAEESGCRMSILEAVQQVNERQKGILFEKFMRHFDGRVEGLMVALWGLAFKPETDDVREAPSMVIIERLLKAGCRVKVYDPVAMASSREVLGERVEYGCDKYDAAQGADALMIVTEWKEFRMPSYSVLRSIMREPTIFDGRNIYDSEEAAEQGFTYYKIG
jgi:UDPglucose 6-dehydrogenase